MKRKSFAELYESIGKEDIAARDLLKAKKTLSPALYKKLQKMLMDGKGKEVIAQLKKSGYHPGTPGKAFFGDHVKESDDKSDRVKAQKTALKAIQSATKAIEKLKGSKSKEIGTAIDESLSNLGFAEDAWDSANLNI